MPDWVETCTVDLPLAAGPPTRSARPSSRRSPGWPTSAPCATTRGRSRGPRRTWSTSCASTSTRSPGTDFADAARAALVLREVLADAGLHGFAKTSGGRGVHVFVPVEPTYGFVEARHAVIALGRELARRMPDEVTISWWKEERGERIFVDFNQMARDRTIASAYSIRPTVDARVSAPLTWEELPDVAPEDFTVRTMPARFAEVGRRLGALLRAGRRARWTRALEMYERDVAELGTGQVRRRRDAVPAGLPEDAGRAGAGAAEPDDRRDQGERGVDLVAKSAARRGRPRRDGRSSRGRGGCRRRRCGDGGDEGDRTPGARAAAAGTQQSRLRSQWAWICFATRTLQPGSRERTQASTPAT